MLLWDNLITLIIFNNIICLKFKRTMTNQMKYPITVIQLRRIIKKTNQKR